jgi:ABC-2 type transport system permease protein
LWISAGYSAAQWQGLPIDVTGWLFFYFVIYFILGFILLSSVMAGIGSICSALRDAQNLMVPITIIYIIPFVSWIKLVQSPQGTYATALSYVPPMTPLVMMIRLTASSEVPIFQIVTTLALLAFSVIVVIWLSAKVFHTGILMYGKRPGLREVVRWLRKS